MKSNFWILSNHCNNKCGIVNNMHGIVTNPQFLLVIVTINIKNRKNRRKIYVKIGLAHKDCYIVKIKIGFVLCWKLIVFTIPTFFTKYSFIKRKETYKYIILYNIKEMCPAKKSAMY